MVAVRLLAVLVLAAAGARVARGEARWGGAVYLGAVWNLPTPLTIRQSGEDDLRVRARYAAHPFRIPLYYVLRVERSDGGRGWALALVHHKLHLTNPPPEVGEFSVTHGYNLLTLERSWREGRVVRLLGAGVVVTHPENTVRGRKLAEDGGPLGGGYHVSGPVVSAALAREVPLGSGWFLPLEGRATAAWARVPVADGGADAPNVALHLTAGVGRR